MQKLILFSKRDIAGSNIAKILIEKYEFENVDGSIHKKGDILVRGIENEVLHLHEFELKPDICVVASRHASESGMVCLTTHTPGNFSVAEFGGDNRSLGISPALYLQAALKNLKKSRSVAENCEICFEATHHGPTQLPFPIMFVEVGSTVENWKSMTMCEIAADAVYETLTQEPEKKEVAIGFGGGHYCRKFSELKKFAMGHICPKYALEKIDEPMIREMIERTKPRPTHALVEKKGMGTEKQRILELLKKTDLKIGLV